MVNFKAGDVVVCMDNTRYTSQVKLGVPKVVHSVSLCGKYLRVLRDDTRNIGGYPAENFILFQEEQDDPLPPAPESGLYFNHDGTRSASLKLEEGRIALGMNASILKVRLTPETALDLAYDLRRMAMEIKRKEKQV